MLVDNLARDIGNTLIWLRREAKQSGVGIVKGQQFVAHLIDALHPLKLIYVASAKRTAEKGIPVGAARKKLLRTPVFKARIRKDSTIDISFDESDPRVVQNLDTYNLKLIRYITGDTEQAIHDIVSSKMGQGLPPAVMARDIKDVVGLTPYQANAVLNYRKALQDNNTRALSLKLRDKRFDTAVESAIDTGEPLGDEKIDKLVDNYAERYLRFRATTIARTESLRAANEGQRVVYDQAVDDGILKKNSVKRFWINTGDHRVRSSHLEIPLLNPDGVGYDEPFQLPDGGTIMGPHDPDADAAEVINCRCTLGYRMMSDDGTDAGTDDGDAEYSDAGA
jgi:hypothetical protein